MQYKQDSIKLCELFAGIGAQAQALRNIGCNVDATVCEIDEAAYRSYCAIHGDTPNLGDITKVEHLPECDILTWSFPCQAISQAGAKKGLDEGSGTSSSLAWEVIRLLKDAKERDALPPILLMENVKALLFDRNIENFDRIRRELEALGYTDDAYDKAEQVGATRSQLYRQAGNSIVVPVLEAIFKGILDGDFEKTDKQQGLDMIGEKCGVLSVRSGRSIGRKGR